MEVAVGAQQPLPCRASRSSLTAMAAMTRAEIGSAQDQPSVALRIIGFGKCCRIPRTRWRTTVGSPPEPVPKRRPPPGSDSTAGREVRPPPVATTRSHRPAGGRPSCDPITRGRSRHLAGLCRGLRADRRLVPGKDRRRSWREGGGPVEWLSLPEDHDDPPGRSPCQGPTRMALLGGADPFAGALLGIGRSGGAEAAAVCLGVGEGTRVGLGVRGVHQFHRASPARSRAAIAAESLPAHAAMAPRASGPVPRGWLLLGFAGMGPRSSEGRRPGAAAPCPGGEGPRLITLYRVGRLWFPRTLSQFGAGVVRGRRVRAIRGTAARRTARAA